MNFEDFYLVLKEKRIEKGYSQKQLGEKCGLSQQAINRIEHGLRGIDIDLFFKICKILDINIPELMGYEYQGGGFYGKEAPAEIQKKFIDKISTHNTIAAHLDSDNFTEEELQKILEFAEFIKSKRKDPDNQGE